MNLVSHILDFNSPMVVCLSGGVDSIALAHLLRHKKPILFHFNHKIRPQNEIMQKSCEEFAKDFNLNLITKSAPTFGDKTEAEARNLRLDMLEENFNGFQCLTGHHLNDAVEGYLMNCLRGNPTHTPIQEISKFKKFTIKRPLIRAKKQKLREYVSHMGLEKYVIEDDTNKIIKGSRRNLIRLQILPILTENEVNLEKAVIDMFYSSKEKKRNLNKKHPCGKIS